MLSYEKKKGPESTIKLPNPTRVEKTKPMPLNKHSYDNVAEMNNFDTPIACTPPDRGFMDNLMRRMERT